ncbi:hypothetical protein SLA2020_155270 [Shorea laevis]
MLLRSSSTPVLGSLLCSVAESPNHETAAAAAAFKHHPPMGLYHKKVSFLPSPGSLHLSCNSSPISPSIADFNGKGGSGFCRAQSDGHLERLAYASCDGNEKFSNETRQPKKIPGRQKCLMLQSIPSFSFYNSKARCEEEDDESGMEDGEEEEEWYLNENEEPLQRNGERGKKVMDMNKGDEKINLCEGIRVMDKSWNVGLERERGFVNQEMFLAKGLGVDGSRGGTVGSNRGGGGGSGSGGGGRFNPADSGGDGGDNHGVEEYYKRMVEENPGDPLFLRNYAQFLYETKQDLHGAEEYYSRAILADPKDGQILSRHAKLLWQLHHDEERASSYFERAVQASPQDSHVHAAYASFLWETEEDEDECSTPYEIESKPPEFREEATANA